MKRKPITFLLVIFLLFTLLFTAYIYHSQPRIAYVRSADLIYGYNGMREAHTAYQNQTNTWQANVDTLRMQYQKVLSDYQNNYQSMSEKERQDKQKLIGKLEENYKNYAAAINKEAEEKEKSMTSGVLNQINSFVQEYAKKKGYDIVLGANGNGNVLYGAKAYDITDEVLKAINKNYKIMPDDKNATH